MKKRWFPLILAVSILTGCKEPELDEEFTKGTEALQQQKYEEAHQHFQMLQEKEYRLPEAYRGSGIAFLKEESYPEAIAAFSRSLNHMDRENKAFRKDVMYYLAESRMQYGEVRKAIEVYGEILKIEKDPQAFFLRGKAYIQNGETEKAEKDFQRAVKDCTDYNLYINIYKIYAECGEEGQGKKYLEQVMEVKPEKGEDYYQRGRIYEFQKNYEMAKESLLTALKMGYEDAVPVLGHLYLLTEDIASARTMYQEYLSKGENSARAYNGLAICDIYEEAYDSAMNNIQKGLEVKNEEETQSLLYNEIVVLENQRQFEQAKEKLKNYLKQYPEDKDALREKEFLSTR